MNVLVVGATGVIGPGVVGALLKLGHRVTALHRGLTAYAFPPSVKVLHVDRRNRREFEGTVSGLGFDAVIDLACYDPEDADSTVRAATGCLRVVVFSSVCTFGGELPAVVNEETPLRPASKYGRDKAAADVRLLNAHSASHVSVTIIKPVACYREGSMLDGQLAESGYWIDQMRRGRRSLLADDGEALWNVLHADDVGRAAALLLTEGAAAGEEVIVASPSPVTWNWYYDAVAEALGVEFLPAYLPAEEILRALGDDAAFLAEQTRWNQVYDTGKLKRLARGFTPEVDLREGLTRAARWLASHGDLADPAMDEAVGRLLSRGRRL